jgi:hypothetical protein
MSTRKAKSTLQESDGSYEQFLRGIDLVSVGLKGCSAFLDRSGLHSLYSETKRPLRSFKGAYKVTQMGEGFFEASGLFIVTVRESPDAKPVLSVECEFEAHLHGIEPIAKGFVERFVNSEFQLILVPYARQFVSSTTAQMSIPPLIIPLSTASSDNSASKIVRPKKPKRVHAKSR